MSPRRGARRHPPREADQTALAVGQAVHVLAWVHSGMVSAPVNNAGLSGRGRRVAKTGALGSPQHFVSATSITGVHPISGFGQPTLPGPLPSTVEAGEPAATNIFAG